MHRDRPPVTVLNADLAEHRDGAVPCLADWQAEVGAQRLGHEVADPPYRVDVNARVLEHHGDLVPVGA